ncbi:MAG: hypothetical protein QM674_09570 [Burkholderiaceae bacterium]
MSVRAPSASRSKKDVAGLRDWLAGAAADESDALSLLDLLARRIGEHAPELSADESSALVEVARERQVAAIEAALRSMAGAAFPLPADDWPRLRHVFAQMRIARDRLLEHHLASVEDSGLLTRTVIPGASDDWRHVASLVHALDLQAWLLREHLLHRIDVDAADWQSLARLAARLRASSFLDAPIPDPTGSRRSRTARALIVHPLLLASARLDERDAAESELIDRLARGWAGKVGLRIDDDGRLHENRHGPTLLLADRLAVRLDTHRLDRRLQERLELLATAPRGEGPRLPAGLTRERCLRLLAELREDWSDAYRPRRWPATRAERILVRFGTPAGDAVPPARQPAAQSASLSPAGLVSFGYAYGQHEQDTLIRRARGLDERPRQALRDYLAQGEIAGRIGDEGGVVVIGRTSLRAVKAGALVAWTPADDPGAPIRVGRVVARRQRAIAEDEARTLAGEAALAQRLMIAPWPHRVEMIRLRIGDDGFFGDALLLAGIDDEPACVVLPPARVREGDSVMLRLPQRDVPAAIGRVLQRGTGFERIAIRLPQD